MLCDNMAKIKGFPFSIPPRVAYERGKTEDGRPFFILWRQAAVAENALGSLYGRAEGLTQAGQRNSSVCGNVPEQSNL